MFKHYAIIALIFLSTLSCKAFQDCILTGNGKLSDIKIEDKRIIEVTHNVTIMNEKDTLIVHPLNEGKTKFSVVYNDKEVIVFNVEVNQFGTVVECIEGFEVSVLDTPPINSDNLLDPPPITQEEIMEIPPQLREGE